MRILWLAPEPPVAPLSGGRERAQRMLCYLAARHRVLLVTFATEAEADAARDLPGPVEQLTFPYLAGRLAPVRRWRVKLAILAAARRFRPDALHVQGAEMWPYLPPGRRPRRILDCHDAPEIAAAGARLQPPPRAIIAVSEPDAARLRASWPETPLCVVPNGVDLAWWQAVQGAPEPGLLLYPAALNWPPNQEAAVTLVNEIMPHLRALGAGAELVIAGRQPSLGLRALAAANHDVTLVADPPDMRPWFARATAVVVPAHQAAGTRLKILQALAAGRPVVSTPEGAAGLPFAAGEHLLVAPLVAPFAEALAGLLADARQRQALVRAGQAVVAGQDWQQLLPALAEVYG